MKDFIGLIIANLIFLAIACGVNKNNAELLIAGYNSMSKEMKDNFDIEKYLTFFKGFFINLSLYSSVIFITVLYLFNIKITIIACTLFLVLAFVYFIIISNGKKFKKN
jgi:ABC-type multidrug transport system fused ATPase/permease subunit